MFYKYTLHLLQSTPEVCEYVRLCVFVRRLCTADLCVLFQNESPTTSRQSPANGHSSINSSILVRTPTPTIEKQKIPRSDYHPAISSSFFFSFFLSRCCVMVFLHVRVVTFSCCVRFSRVVFISFCVKSCHSSGSSRIRCRRVMP